MPETKYLNMSAGIESQKYHYLSKGTTWVVKLCMKIFPVDILNYTVSLKKKTLVIHSNKELAAQMQTNHLLVPQGANQLTLMQCN